MATEMSEERLIDKFKRNAQGIIGESKASEAIDALLGLKKQEDISMLMKLLVP
jgi:2-methylcitrate dehydratase